MMIMKMAQLTMKIMMKKIFKFKPLKMTKNTYLLTHESIINTVPIILIICAYTTSSADYTRKK